MKYSEIAPNKLATVLECNNAIQCIILDCSNYEPDKGLWGSNKELQIGAELKIQAIRERVQTIQAGDNKNG